MNYLNLVKRFGCAAVAASAMGAEAQVPGMPPSSMTTQTRPPVIIQIPSPVIRLAPATTAQATVVIPSNGAPSTASTVKVDRGPLTAQATVLTAPNQPSSTQATIQLQMKNMGLQSTIVSQPGQGVVSTTTATGSANIGPVTVSPTVTVTTVPNAPPATTVILGVQPKQP